MVSICLRDSNRYRHKRLRDTDRGLERNKTKIYKKRNSLKKHIKEKRKTGKSSKKRKKKKREVLRPVPLFR